jgi:hypothetical protein
VSASFLPVPGPLATYRTETIEALDPDARCGVRDEQTQPVGRSAVRTNINRELFLGFLLRHFRLSRGNATV